MAKIVDNIYSYSPVWLQNIGITVYGFFWKKRRQGRYFKELVQSFKSREDFSLEDWGDYQTRLLRKLLLHANSNTAYFQKLFQRAGLKLEDIMNFRIDDLNGLPFLEKEVIRRDPNILLDQRMNRRHVHAYHTSGTTGTPLAIMMTNSVFQEFEAAYEARVRNWAGLNYRMSRAMIGGRMIVPEANSSLPYWRYNFAERQLYMSAFHVAPANAQHYVDAINSFRPDYLVGYASSHYFLARMIAEKGLQVYQPRAILTSSEKLTSEMRETLERVYRCEVFDAYSGVEDCCLISECEQRNYHISPDVGIVELLDDQGQSVEPGQIGEIVATGLINFDQPLIRYRTGDLAILSEERCPCGREMPVVYEIIGRLEDTVIGADGREMVRFHGIFVGLPHVREGQVIQKNTRDFTVRLAVDPDFNYVDRQIIHKRFEERLGPINLEFEFVDRIKRTNGGKFRAVISHVKREPANLTKQDTL